MPRHIDFYFACCFDRVGEVEGLLAEGVSPNSTDSDGDPAVVVAARMGSAAALRVLLGAPGLAVDSPHPLSGTTALMAASQYGERECVELLLGGGADPALKDKEGKTALDKAEGNGHAEVAALLRAAAAQAAQPQAPASPTNLQALTHGHRLARCGVIAR